ncbi:hypothetical protein LINPERHAP1_LOCUS31030 [Linum perenne]
MFLDLLPADYVLSGPPTVQWPLNRAGTFSVQSLHNELRIDKFTGFADFLAKVVWCSMAPTKVQCFVWASFHGRIATLDNLQQRGFQLPNRCSLCCCKEESGNHVFIHCKFVVKVWGLISSKLSISSPLPADICQLIKGWKGMNCSGPFSDNIAVVLQSFLWSLWLERNRRIFRDESRDEKTLCIYIYIYIFFMNVSSWKMA